MERRNDALIVDGGVCFSPILIVSYMLLYRGIVELMQSRQKASRCCMLAVVGSAFTTVVAT